MACRIYADFNGLTGSRRDGSMMVPLDTWGSLRDLSNAGIRLHEGTALVIWDASDETEDLEARAVACYEPERSRWCAEFEEYEYVPAGNRSPRTFLCLDCRTDLGSRAARAIDEHCPDCGLPIRAAIEAP